MKTFRRIGLFLAGLLAGLANAAGMSPDPTGLWFDPAQPGWGLDVAQQGDTVFAILFTYDAGHKPVWFVASNMKASASAASGTLYRTTGPTISAATFDSHAVTTTAVGELDISYVPGTEPRNLAVKYSVDGVQVSHTIQAQSWSNDTSGLSGGYGGQLFLTLAPGSSDLCPSPTQVTIPPIQPFQPYAFSILPSLPGHVFFGWGSGVDLACTADAQYSRDGQLAAFSGHLACGPIGGPIGNSNGPLVAVGNITENAAGFFGSAHVEATVPVIGTCIYDGTFGGVHMQASSLPGMNPDPTGVWFNPDEPGWGVILTQQGATTFAALFGYDAAGNATWWAASNVVDTGHPVNLLVQEAFSGALYRTSGPYLGAAGDTTTLSATPVGTLQVAYIGGTDKLVLSYAIDGVMVDKTVQRETWASNAALLSGNFTGGLFPPGLFCPALQMFTPLTTTFNVTPGSSPASLHLTWAAGTDNHCFMDGTYAQTGQFGSLAGLVQCGPATDPQANMGSITISSMSVTPQGFAGFANFTAGGCAAGGFIGGVKR